MAAYSPKAEDKIHRVLHEYGRGKLHSSSKHGPKVKGRDQAVAIAISEARDRGYKVPKAAGADDWCPWSPW